MEATLKGICHARWNIPTIEPGRAGSSPLEPQHARCIEPRNSSHANTLHGKGDSNQYHETIPLHLMFNLWGRVCISRYDMTGKTGFKLTNEALMISDLWVLKFIPYLTPTVFNIGSNDRTRTWRDNACLIGVGFHDSNSPQVTRLKFPAPAQVQKTLKVAHLKI